MSVNDTGRNAMLTGGLGNAVTHLSLHTADPGTTGANEATGGSPAYARKGVSWAAASGGQRASSNSQTFDVPAGSYPYVGFWDALTAGNFYGYAPNGNFAPQVGTVANTGDVVTSYGHGLANDNRVLVFDIQAAGVPTGLTEGTVYWVVGVTANTFQLSATQGGAAVAISADGEIGFHQIVPETFGGQGQLSLAAGATVLDARIV